MTWLYVSEIEIRSGALRLERDAAHYLGRVLRARPGDSLVVFDGLGTTAQATVGELSKGSVTLDVSDPVMHERPATHLRAELCLVKGERLDWAVQKLTELGVDHIETLGSERTVVRAFERADSRRDRLHSIAVAAAAQCHRPWLPTLGGPSQLADLRPMADEDSFVLDPGAQAPAHWFRAGRRVRYAIGPEGGWTDTERATLMDRGYRSLGLGSLVLRAETAAIAAAVVLSERLGRFA